MNSDTIVKIENLTFSYDGLRDIFKDFNLTVKKGELLILKGKSGSGKSTLFNIVCGVLALNNFSSGKIYIEQKELSEIDAKTMASTLGVVFSTPQNRIIAPTVEQEIFFGLQNLCVEKDVILEKTDKVLERFKIKKLRELNPHNLSGGQVELVTIAAVVAMSPKIYLFDEIFSMLDELNKDNVKNIVLELVKDGATVILADHTGVLDAAANRVVDLSFGGKDVTV